MRNQSGAVRFKNYTQAHAHLSRHGATSFWMELGIQRSSKARECAEKSNYACIYRKDDTFDGMDFWRVIGNWLFRQIGESFRDFQSVLHVVFDSAGLVFQLS